MYKLTKEEVSRAKEALSRFKEDPCWKDFLKLENVFLANLQETIVPLEATNYSYKQAYRDGQIMALKTLQAERRALLDYNKGETRNGTVIQFTPKSK